MCNTDGCCCNHFHCFLVFVISFICQFCFVLSLSCLFYTRAAEAAVVRMCHHHVLGIITSAPVSSRIDASATCMKPAVHDQETQAGDWFPRTVSSSTLRKSESFFPAGALTDQPPHMAQHPYITLIHRCASQCFARYLLGQNPRRCLNELALVHCDSCAVTLDLGLQALTV